MTTEKTLRKIHNYLTRIEQASYDSGYNPQYFEGLHYRSLLYQCQADAGQALKMLETLRREQKEAKENVSP